jgi:hypothetical protein
MIGVEREFGLALLFLAETIKAFDRRMAMRAILPFAGGTPFELGGLRRVRQCFAGSEQSLDVNAIVNQTLTISHGTLLTFKPERTLRTSAGSLSQREMPRRGKCPSDAASVSKKKNSIAAHRQKRK